MKIAIFTERAPVTTRMDLGALEANVPVMGLGASRGMQWGVGGSEGQQAGAQALPFSMVLSVERPAAALRRDNLQLRRLHS